MASDYSNKDLEKYTAAFQRGEEQGFNYFFKTLYPALLYYAFNAVKSKDQAEKIINDAFIQVWEQHEHFHSAEEIRNSLYKKIGAICIEQELIQEDPDKVLSPNKAIVAEFMQQMHLTMNALPDDCRRIFEMIYIEGKKISDIATELNIHVSAVENQRTLGIAILKKKFPDIFTE